MTKEKKQANIKKKHSGKPIEERSKEEIIKLYNQLKQDKEKENKELLETLQRLQADFENYRKRTEKQNQEFCKFANKELIIKILPLLDNFELALKNTKNHDEFIKGIELIYSQLITLLEEQGLKKIETIGGKFNPHLHEALMQEKHEDKEENIIIEEFQKGYTLNDQIIRHSKVKVSKK